MNRLFVPAPAACLTSVAVPIATMPDPEISKKRHLPRCIFVMCVLACAGAQAAPKLVTKTTGNVEISMPIGTQSFVFDGEALPVETLGTNLARDFAHTSSFLTQLSADFSGFALWTDGNWPEGTTGTVAVNFEFGIASQELDGSEPSVNTDFWTTFEPFPYECEAPEGCPLGDPELANESFRRTFSGNGSLTAPGREVSEALAFASVELSNPEHGIGQVNVSANFLIEQRYEVRYDKLFADFLSDTASEFDDIMTIISLASTAGSGATSAEVAGAALAEAGTALLAGDACAETAISSAMKEVLLSKIENLSPAAAAPGANIIASVSLAAGVASIVSRCLAEDPPDLDVYTTTDPNELFAGIDVPSLVPGADGDTIAAAIERDMKIALALAAALDAYERMQGAEILGDDAAYELQLADYLFWMETAESESVQSASFYEFDSGSVYTSTGVLDDIDIVNAIAALETIDDELIMSELNIQDPADVAIIAAKVDSLFSVATSEDWSAGPVGRVESLAALYGLVGGYATTDLSTVIDNQIGGQFWTSLAPTIAIDIEPSSKKNGIAPGGGVIPVAIFGSQDFDALQVDRATLVLGLERIPVLPWRFHNRDMNRDGFTDLLVFFPSDSLAISCADSALTMTGFTFAGELFAGTDSVRVVGCRPRPRPVIDLPVPSSPTEPIFRTPRVHQDAVRCEALDGNCVQKRAPGVRQQRY